jgi:hypothetical protein
LAVDQHSDALAGDAQLVEQQFKLPKAGMELLLSIAEYEGDRVRAHEHVAVKSYRCVWLIAPRKAMADIAHDERELLGEEVQQRSDNTGGDDVAQVSLRIERPEQDLWPAAIAADEPP